MFIFILGMEKSATTALAHYLVSNFDVEYLDPGNKEPQFLLQQNFSLGVNKSKMRLLDASVMYSQSGMALDKIPENSQSILCLRNSFERSWSAYQMHKTIALGGARLDAYAQSHPSRPDWKTGDPSMAVREAVARTFRPEVRDVVRNYWTEEAERIQSQSFLERVEYEIAFFLRTGHYPFFSILVQSFLTTPIKNIIHRLAPEKYKVVNVNSLECSRQRAAFIGWLFPDDHQTTPSIQTAFSQSASGYEENKPDFSANEYDALRYYFRCDLLEFRRRLEAADVDQQFIDWKSMDRWIA